jgi:nucleoid-associated protein YgaU
MHIGIDRLQQSIATINCNNQSAPDVASAGPIRSGGVMSIATFVRDAGERIIANAKAAIQLNPGGAREATAERSPQEASKPRRMDTSAGDAIENYIRVQGLDVQDLSVNFDAPTATVHIAGKVRDQATKEKVILCCGNVAGVEKVEEDLIVREQAPPSSFHTVQKGDSLSKIAQQVYGDANKYQAIFEANKPMLKHPDKIYPGQSLRIPPLN